MSATNTQSSNSDTIRMNDRDKQLLERAAYDIYESGDVSYSRVLRRLAADHEDVRFPL